MTNDYAQTLAEQYIAELSDAEFDQLVARTRPPRLDDIKSVIAREMNKQGMTLADPIPLNSDKIADRALGH